MNTYFIRHSPGLGITDKTREMIWDKKLIAVHFPHDKNGNLLKVDNSSLNPLDYPSSGRTAIQILKNIATEGGYICADYSNHPGCSVVGKVNPKSTISITQGTSIDGRKALLKSLKLLESKVIPHADMIGVYARRPRQGTIRRWPKAAMDIKILLEGKVGLSASKNLHSSRQESLCAEFLRLPEAKQLGVPTLKFMLLLGRTLKAIDIYGLSETGKKIFAQVTNYTSNDSAMKRKVEALKSYGGANAELILFCNADAYSYKNGIHTVPLKMVLQTFDQPGLRRLALTSC